MARPKRVVTELRKRAINSFLLGIELFNRLYDVGRPEAVLIFLHHAFEMLLKAIIRDRTGTIHEKGEKYSYTFKQCLVAAHEQLGIISPDERATLSILDALRDTATHYYQDISEDLLYLQAQAAVSLFDQLLQKGFALRLGDILPSRVLPISTRPPKDLQLLIDSELRQIDELLEAGSRKGTQAAARLRPLVALAAVTRENYERPTEKEIKQILTRRRRGQEWTVILPEIVRLELNTEGEGIPFFFKIKNDAELAIRIAKEGDPIVGTMIKHEINIWDKFNLGRDDLAEKLGLSGPKTSALIYELGIQDDPECYRVLTKKSMRFQGYSKKALDHLRGAIKDGIDIEEVWRKHRHRFGHSNLRPRDNSPKVAGVTGKTLYHVHRPGNIN